jgi:hypothetical protein
MIEKINKEINEVQQQFIKRNILITKKSKGSNEDENKSLKVINSVGGDSVES